MIRIAWITVTAAIIVIMEVVAYLKTTERTAYHLVADRQIPAFKVEKSWRILYKDFEA